MAAAGFTIMGDLFGRISFVQRSFYPQKTYYTTKNPQKRILFFFCERREDKSSVRTQIEANKKSGTRALSDVSGDAIARPTWPTMEDLPGRASPDLCGHSRLKSLIDRLSCNRATSSRDSF